MIERTTTPESAIENLVGVIPPEGFHDLPLAPGRVRIDHHNAEVPSRKQCLLHQIAKAAIEEFLPLIDGNEGS